MNPILILGILTLAGPAAGDEPRWYMVELEGGQQLSVRFVSEDDASYDLDYQGSPLKVAKADVRALTPIARPAGKPADARAEAGKPAGRKVDEDALRDALESLGSTDDADARRGYGVLAASFADAHPLVQAALVHANPRVRALAVKLLGEKGSAKEDLTAVASRLNDDKVSVRRAAVFALRNLGVEGFPHLVRYLDAEPDANNRKMAVKTLQHWGDRRAVLPLATRLGHEPDDGVRNFIAVALRVLTRKDLGTDAKAWEALIAEERQREESERLAREQAARRLSGEANEEESHENE